MRNPNPVCEFLDPSIDRDDIKIACMCLTGAAHNAGRPRPRSVLYNVSRVPKIAVDWLDSVPPLPCTSAS